MSRRSRLRRPGLAVKSVLLAAAMATLLWCVLVDGSAATIVRGTNAPAYLYPPQFVTNGDLAVRKSLNVFEVRPARLAPYARVLVETRDFRKWKPVGVFGSNHTHIFRTQAWGPSFYRLEAGSNYMARLKR